MQFSHVQKQSADCKAVRLDNVVLTVCGDHTDEICRFWADKQIPCASDGNVQVISLYKNDRALTYIEESRRITDEKYILEIAQNGTQFSVRITYGGRRALYYALHDLARQFASRTIRLGQTEHYPLFAMRGYIEGFYGAPWTPTQRTQMLRFLSGYRMNAYFYAPKDDPYHREHWREPYPADALDALRTLVQTADDCFVDFWYCIAPGLDVVYSDDRQLSALVQKCRQLYGIGVRRFGLLFDDIPDTLEDPEDAARYDEPVLAHIDFTNRVWDALQQIDDACELVVCPLQYHGDGDEYYISKLGQNIDPRIRLFWTGSDICSKRLTSRDAIRFGEHTRHKPLYWDNFPVNDAEMANEMHLGYCFGRDADLYRFCDGLIANCMPYFACSRIPLLTVADYLWDPVRYDPIPSWEYALQTVVGADAPVFGRFAEHLLVSCLKTNVSPHMCTVLSDAMTAYRRGNVKQFALHLSDYADELDDCVALLDARKAEALYRELTPWSQKFRLMARTIRLCADYANGGGDALPLQIEAALRQYFSLPQVMADFTFQSFTEWLLHTAQPKSE